jgi:hypothetical protein
MPITTFLADDEVGVDVACTSTVITISNDTIVDKNNGGRPRKGLKLENGIFLLLLCIVCCVKEKKV